MSYYEWIPAYAGMTGGQPKVKGLSNKVFASKYKLVLPSEKELRAKLKSLPLLEGKIERNK